MKKLFLLLTVALSSLSGLEMMAQQVQPPRDGIYDKEHVANRKPIPYPYIREADVMWAKKVWRIIDLREKMNLPLYYPTQKVDDRYSLIGLLVDRIQYGGLTVYNAKNDDEFKIPMTFEQVSQEMGAIADTQYVDNPVTGQREQKVIAGEIKQDEVKKFLVKEVWFFDRNYSKMDVRIVGICPIREYLKTSDSGEGSITQKKLFWVYFPSVRDEFSKHEVFNPKNDAQRRTFDDIFMKRYFTSYISKESNVYNNREITDYTLGVESMIESERIKNSIVNYEHDLWEY